MIKNCVFLEKEAVQKWPLFIISIPPPFFLRFVIFMDQSFPTKNFSEIHSPEQVQNFIFSEGPFFDFSIYKGIPLYFEIDQNMPNFKRIFKMGYPWKPQDISSCWKKLLGGLMDSYNSQKKFRVD